MISFACPECGKTLEAQDGSAGAETTCSGCGKSVRVPIDIPCDGPSLPPDAQTIPIAELEAIRKERKKT